MIIVSHFSSSEIAINEIKGLLPDAHYAISDKACDKIGTALVLQFVDFQWVDGKTLEDLCHYHRLNLIRKHVDAKVPIYGLYRKSGKVHVYKARIDEYEKVYYLTNTSEKALQELTGNFHSQASIEIDGVTTKTLDKRILLLLR